MKASWRYRFWLKQAKASQQYDCQEQSPLANVQKEVQAKQLGQVEAIEDEKQHFDWWVEVVGEFHKVKLI